MAVQRTGASRHAEWRCGRAWWLAPVADLGVRRCYAPPVNDDQTRDTSRDARPAFPLASRTHPGLSRPQPPRHFLAHTSSHFYLCRMERSFCSSLPATYRGLGVCATLRAYDSLTRRRRFLGLLTRHAIDRIRLSWRVTTRLRRVTLGSGWRHRRGSLTVCRLRLRGDSPPHRELIPMTATPNHALQRTRPLHWAWNPGARWAGSLSWGRSIP